GRPTTSQPADVSVGVNAAPRSGVRNRSAGDHHRGMAAAKRRWRLEPGSDRTLEAARGGATFARVKQLCDRAGGIRTATGRSQKERSPAGAGAGVAQGAPGSQEWLLGSHVDEQAL